MEVFRKVSGTPLVNLSSIESNISDLDCVCYRNTIPSRIMFETIEVAILHTRQFLSIVRRLVLLPFVEAFRKHLLAAFSSVFSLNLRDMCSHFSVIAPAQIFHLDLINGCIFSILSFIMLLLRSAPQRLNVR